MGEEDQTLLSPSSHINTYFHDPPAPPITLPSTRVSRSTSNPAIAHPNTAFSVSGGADRLSNHPPLPVNDPHLASRLFSHHFCGAASTLTVSCCCKNVFSLPLDTGFDKF